MRTRRSLTMLAATPLAVLVALTGCSGPAPDGGGATGSPIVVADVSSLAFFPEAPQAVQAVFDEYNAAGGLHGRPLQYSVIDDRADPSTSATAAQSAVASGAVALVGSSSLLDCQINNATWMKNNIVSIQGTAVDPFCFTSPNIAPTNTGPYFGAFATLYYGSEKLGLKNICAVYTPDSPAIQSAFRQAFAAWSKVTGKKLAYIDETLTRGQASYAANVATMAAKGCDAIFDGDTGDSVLKYLGEAANQGLTPPALALTSSFSDAFAQASSYPGDIYVMAEFAPYFDTSIDGNADWAALMDKYGVPKTSFAQGGYLAAKYFIDILESVAGDVTRDAVTAAAKAMTTPIDIPMAQSPWIFGPGDAHQPNDTVYPVQLTPGSGVWSARGPLIDGASLGWTGISAGSLG